MFDVCLGNIHLISTYNGYSEFCTDAIVTRCSTRSVFPIFSELCESMLQAFCTMIVDILTYVS